MRAVVAVFKVVHGFGVEHTIVMRFIVICRGISFIVWIFKMWEIFTPTKVDDLEGSHPERSHSVTQSFVNTQQAILQSARSKQVPAAGEKVKADQNGNLKRKIGRGRPQVRCMQPILQVTLTMIKRQLALWGRCRSCFVLWFRWWCSSLYWLCCMLEEHSSTIWFREAVVRG